MWVRCEASASIGIISLDNKMKSGCLTKVFSQTSTFFLGKKLKC